MILVQSVPLAVIVVFKTTNIDLSVFSSLLKHIATHRVRHLQSRV